MAGTCSCNHFEAQGDQVAGNASHLRLVVVTHADERGTAGRQHFAGTHLGLGEGFTEAVTHAHDFTGRFHLRAEDRVNPWELGEREDGFLDAVEVRDDFLGEAQLFQGFAGHDAGAIMAREVPMHLDTNGTVREHAG